MSASAVVVASALYLGVLFAIAFVVDRHGAGVLPRWIPQSWIFALSLAVYSTSWTYFGSVGQAATGSMSFIPISLGPLLVLAFGQPVLRKLLRVCHTHHITSLADLLAARYSRRHELAALAAIAVAIGVIPYISLQLKAVSTTFNVLAAPTWVTGENWSGAPTAAPVLGDTAFYLALVMAGFVMLFGTRRVDATEQHGGMVTTIAFESLVKLAALCAVGLFVTFTLHDGVGPLFDAARANANTARLTEVSAQLGTTQFWAVALLSATAIICLPRQFQVLVVENVQIAHLRTAASVFPAYLLLLNLFILPIALAGALSPRLAGHSPDTFVLALPLSEGNPGLALFAYLGGFSAATSMIIVETIALSTMIGNALVLPLVIRGQRLLSGQGSSMVALVKRIRRMLILAILLLAYAYERIVGNSFALTGIGLVSFVAAAQLAPMIAGALYWRNAHWRGAWWGLLAGFGLWSYTLLIPSFAESGWLPRSFIEAGPFGLAALRPYALFGLEGLDRITHGMLWSLGCNVLIFVTLSALSRQTSEDRANARSFTERTPTRPEREFTARVQWRDLQHLLTRFLGEDSALRALTEHARERKIAFDETRLADGEIVTHVERVLAGAIGSSLARIVVATAIGERQHSMAGVMSMLSEASVQIEMQWERLREAVQNINEGLAMFDANLRLVVWNDRFLTMFGLPAAFGTVGTPLDALVRAHAEASGANAQEQDSLLMASLERAANPQAQVFEHRARDGRYIEVYSKPLAGGGLIATFTDITARRQAEDALRAAKANLEEQVESRTAEVRESERRFRDFAESASDWLWECDAALRLTRLSDRASELLGRSAETLVGVALPTLADPAHVNAATWAQHLDDLAQHRPFNGMEYPITQGPEQIACMRLSGKPVFDRDGRFIGYRGTAADITALVQAQGELVRQEKMVALGGLVAGVAHEINTPVGIAITAASYLQERKKVFAARFASGQMKRSELEGFLAATDEALASIEANLARAANMVRSFKQVAVDQSSDARRRFNVSEYIGEVLYSLRPRLKHTPHRIQVDCPPTLELDSYPGAWSQILTNLIINSLQHGLSEEYPGEITIGVSAGPRSVTLVYRDDGRGMAREQAAHIFEPFFTTMRGAGGSGLGMHIVFNLVTQQLGGKISCTTAPEMGICFTMTFPLNKEAADE